MRRLAWALCRRLAAAATLRISFSSPVASINSKAKPADNQEHSDPADIAGRGANGVVMLQESPLTEQRTPVVFSPADKRQSLIACIGHIRSDIGEIFEEPEPAEGEPRCFALKKEICRAKERHDQFPERAAEDHQRFPKPAEEKVTPFVDDQIDVV